MVLWSTLLIPIHSSDFLNMSDPWGLHNSIFFLDKQGVQEALVCPKFILSLFSSRKVSMADTLNLKNIEIDTETCNRQESKSEKWQRSTGRIAATTTASTFSACSI